MANASSNDAIRRHDPNIRPNALIDQFLNTLQILRIKGGKMGEIKP